jgi:hypothetical protein
MGRVHQRDKDANPGRRLSPASLVDRHPLVVTFLPACASITMLGPQAHSLERVGENGPNGAQPVGPLTFLERNARQVTTGPSESSIN